MEVLRGHPGGTIGGAKLASSFASVPARLKMGESASQLIKGHPVIAGIGARLPAVFDGTVARRTVKTA